MTKARAFIEQVGYTASLAPGGHKLFEEFRAVFTDFTESPEILISVLVNH